LEKKTECSVCVHHCELSEGARGRCLARVCRDGRIIAENYGRITSLALDPIEKKPLHRFYPGSKILSVGSYGCNLSCPFCQNHEISHPQDLPGMIAQTQTVSPEQLTALAERYLPQGNIGVAFTYNEPLVGYEYVRDTAKLLREKGMKTVLVTAGMASKGIAEEVCPYIDAMNIDLKSFTDRFYSELIGGDRRMVTEFIEEAVKHCHVELTCLIIPGENDSEEEMERLAAYIASLKDGEGSKIPLHVSRFFPRYRMQDREATEVARVYRLAEVAAKYLDYVYTGNC